MVFQAIRNLLGFGTQDTSIDDVGSQTGARLAFNGDLCATGTTPNEDRTQCVVDPSVCANGTLADGLCTIDPVFDSAFCATGTTSSNNECVAKLACGPGTIRDGDQCVAEAPVSGDPIFDSAFCAAGTTPSNNKCVAKLACGPGTKRVGDQCVVGCEDGYVLSEDHVCAEKPWPEFESCRFYDFMHRPENRNKWTAVCPKSFRQFDKINTEFDEIEQEVTLEQNRMTKEINELKIENRDLDNVISGLESEVSNLKNKVNGLEQGKASREATRRHARRGGQRAYAAGGLSARVGGHK